MDYIQGASDHGEVAKWPSSQVRKWGHVIIAIETDRDVSRVDKWTWATEASSEE